MAVVSLTIVLLFLRWQFSVDWRTKFWMDLIVVWAGALATGLFVTWGPVEFKLFNKAVALIGAATLLIFGSYKARLDAQKAHK